MLKDFYSWFLLRSWIGIDDIADFYTLAEIGLK